MKMGEKLQGLQEEKHQLFLQLKKVLHEEEKRRRKEQRCCGGSFFLSFFLSFYLAFIFAIHKCKTYPHFGACFPISDITTLTSASYQSSLPMHASQHLLSIPGLGFYSYFLSQSVM